MVSSFPSFFPREKELIVRRSCRYAFAKANEVLLIDEFDLIDNDLNIFRAFTPASFRGRVQQLFDTFDKIWMIRIDNGEIFREGEMGEHDRARGVVDLLKRFSHVLPNMKIVYNGHDGARVGVTWEERKRLQDLVLAREGSFSRPSFPLIPSLTLPASPQ